MSIPNKLDTITNNESRVYEAGLRRGYDEGYTNGYNDGERVGTYAGREEGMEFEREAFWNTFQFNGKRNHYRYAFYNEYWNDTNYNPMYPIICSNVSTDMMRYSKITDTKVDINFSHVNSETLFANNSHLTTIRKLIVTESVKYTNWFAQCSSLTDVTFEGTIGQTINFQNSPLSVDSMISVITHLKDYTETSYEYAYTVKFSDDCWVALETNGGPPPDTKYNTWVDYVNGLCWLT